MSEKNAQEILSTELMLAELAASDEEEEAFDFEELESKLDAELESQLGELGDIKEEYNKIGSPDALGETIKNVVWEQFINQIGVNAGEDFIKDNHGLNLDLSNDAHIQTADNFAKGKIATHNHISKDKLEQNYDRYKNTSHKEFREKYVNPGMDATLKRAGELNKQGVDTVTDIYTGRKIPTKTTLDNGKNNPKAAQREHVKSSAELYKNASLQMANNNEELAGIINNPENLQGYTTAERNNRKSDNSANEMSDADKNKHWEKANKKAEEYIKKKEKEGEDRLKQEGRKTQKEEAFRIGGKALRAVVMQLIAELMKEIISKLVEWFKEKKKQIKTLGEKIKEAVISFISKLKTHVINAGKTITTTIATAIIGPVVGLLKKVWTILKQGVKSLKEAVNFLRNPANKNMPFSIKILEVGKIVTVGLTGIGALVLGELIEKGLMALPGVGAIFAFEIPILGSLASLLGLFLGGVVAGIIGAIAINMIQKKIEEQQKQQQVIAQIEKGNQILASQKKLQQVSEEKLRYIKEKENNVISERHKEATNTIHDSVQNIMDNCKADESISTIQDEISSELDKLLGEM